MKFYQIIKQSFKAIFANKGRSFLTVLGIIIGIGSVIALVSLGNGVQASISSRISSLGSTTLNILPGEGFGGDSGGNPLSRGQSSGSKSGSGGGNSGGFAQAASTLSNKDLASLQDKTKHPLIKAVTGDITGSAIFKVAGQDQRMTVTGVSLDYFSIHTLNLDKGKGVLLTDSDLINKRHVVVLGSQFASDVLGSTNVVNKNLIINNKDYSVVGVLKQADENGFSNPNSQAFIPNTVASVEFSTDAFSRITVQANTENDVDAVKTDVENTLLANHGITNAKLADFSVNTAKDLLSTVNNITGILTSLLAGIAAISLLVGGIGIMNIMLVSVTERTREIGLRKAVGATVTDILIQFIIEAVLLTVTGGVLGILLGKLIGLLAAHFLSFSPIITLSSVLLAVGVSSVVGLVFGIYPAAKAANLNPIDALRSE